MLLAAVVLLFIIAPLLHLLLAASPVEIFQTIQDKEVTDSMGMTLLTSAVVSLSFSVFAIPLAYLLARRQFWGKQMVEGLIDLPIMIPHSAAGIALLGVLSRHSLLGQVADSVGVKFIGTTYGIGLAMAFVSLPFLLNAARDGFLSVPERYEKAALSLGASPVRVFFSISLPLASRNIFSGLIMMFARGISEFGAVIIIAYHPMVTPVLIYERFTAFGLKYAQPVSIIFIFISLVFFSVLRILAKKR